jgi:SAM-dependent methyltransferase
MTKLHWACGDIYLSGYINIDITGFVLNEYEGRIIAHNIDTGEIHTLVDNPNETTLDKYFKFPFGTPPRLFYIDKKLNILNPWPWDSNSVDEVVMISCIEHFHPKTELPHILAELNRTIKKGGRFVVDWPDLKRQVKEYYESDPEFLMELVYCNHKNQYSIHHWGFTEKTFPNYLGKNWNYDFKEVVRHDYPMMGCIATKDK